MPSEYRTINGVKTYLEFQNLSRCKGNEINSHSEKIPFLIQHGHSANRFFVKPVFDYFARLGWPVIMFDWRGHGWSQKGLTGQYKLDYLVNDLHGLIHDFLELEYGYKQCDLLGHSMGGFVAMKYVLKYPQDIRKLIPIATTACVNLNKIVELGMRFLVSRYKQNYDVWFTKKKAAHLEVGIEFFPQWTDKSLLPDPHAVIELMEDMYSYDIRQSLRLIRCPTAVWVGDHDTLKGSSQKIARLIPGAQFEVIKGATHNITIHARDVLPQKIESFLSR